MGNIDPEVHRKSRGGAPASPTSLKRKTSSVAPGGAKRVEFSDYIQGITSIWILHPVFLGAMSRYAAFHRSIAEQVENRAVTDHLVAVLLPWQLVACFASLWYWWNRGNSVAKWFDRMMATGCAVGYMLICLSVGGSVLAWSGVLLVISLTFFIAGWCVEDWFWCHVGFRYFIFWLSYLNLASHTLPALPSNVLVTSVAMFSHILLERLLAEQKGLEFGMQKSYSQGILRCGAAAVASGSFAWAAAS